MPQRHRAPQYLPPKRTKSGQMSDFQTVRIHGKWANAESVALYIQSTYQLRTARRLWIVGYGTPTGQSEGEQAEQTPDGKAYFTLMPARRGDYYQSAAALAELEEYSARLFADIDYIDINWRVS